MTKTLALPFVILFLSILVFPQDATAPSVRLKTINFNVAAQPDGSTDIELSLIFIGKPSTYFHNLQEDPLRLVLEFYDAQIGRYQASKLEGGPITGSTVEESIEDMTKVEGLKSEVKKLVRVTLFLKDKFSYEVSDDFNVITLAGKWKPVPGGISTQPGSPKGKKWLTPVAAASGVLGVTALLIAWCPWCSDPIVPVDSCLLHPELCGDPFGSPPDRPTTGQP